MYNDSLAIIKFFGSYAEMSAEKEKSKRQEQRSVRAAACVKENKEKK